VTAVLAPGASGKPVAARGFGGQERISLGEASPTTMPEWATEALTRLAVPKSNIRPAVSTLANGVTLIVQPENVSDTVSVYGQVRNRPELQAPRGKEGVSEVLAGLFPYGSRKLDRVAFQQALDAIGAEAHAGADFSLLTLAGSFEQGVELLADNLLHPALPPQALDVVRRQVAEAVAGRIGSPSYLSEKALRVALFPPHDPSLREATPETVKALGIEDVRKYYRSAFRPDLTTIVVVGKVTPQRARSIVEKYFGAWRASGPPPVTVLPRVPPNTPGASAVPDHSRVQDRVTLAETLGLLRSSPDYHALELGNAVLGGGFYSARLTRDIRKDAGLVYYVQSRFQFSRTRGLYLVEYACDPQNVAKVHAMVAEELKRMQQNPVTADELQRARALLLRRIPLEEAGIDDIARALIERRSLGLPLDEPTMAARRYLSLAPGDVQAAFAKWLRPGALVRVSQGPTPP
jgi:zinc protease